jgi:hypothetical protein
LELPDGLARRHHIGPQQGRLNLPVLADLLAMRVEGRVEFPEKPISIRSPGRSVSGEAMLEVVMPAVASAPVSPESDSV